jgi:hypothetical protein
MGQSYHEIANGEKCLSSSDEGIYFPATNPNALADVAVAAVAVVAVAVEHQQQQQRSFQTDTCNWRQDVSCIRCNQTHRWYCPPSQRSGMAGLNCVDGVR